MPGFQSWPSQDIVLLRFVCARINRTFLLPAHLHCPHCCITIARLLGSIRPPLDLVVVCRTPYKIGNNNIVQRPNVEGAAGRRGSQTTNSVGRSGPNLEPGTLVVYVIHSSQNGWTIGGKVGPCPGTGDGGREVVCKPFRDNHPQSQVPG